MKQRILIGLTAANLVLLLTTLARQIQPALAQGGPSILRGSGLEIVDHQGRVRASISVMPASRDTGKETVLFRLITERGRPSVKIGASEETAGLSFAGPTGTHETYVILQSKRRVSSLSLRNEDGKQQVLKP